MSEQSATTAAQMSGTVASQATMAGVSVTEAIAKLIKALKRDHDAVEIGKWVDNGGGIGMIDMYEWDTALFKSMATQMDVPVVRVPLESIGGQEKYVYRDCDLQKVNKISEEIEKYREGPVHVYSMENFLGMYGDKRVTKLEGLDFCFANRCIDRLRLNEIDCAIKTNTNNGTCSIYFQEKEKNAATNAIRDASLDMISPNAELLKEKITLESRVIADFNETLWGRKDGKAMVCYNSMEANHFIELYPDGCVEHINGRNIKEMPKTAPGYKDYINSVVSNFAVMDICPKDNFERMSEDDKKKQAEHLQELTLVQKNTDKLTKNYDLYNMKLSLNNSVGQKVVSSEYSNDGVSFVLFEDYERDNIEKEETDPKLLDVKVQAMFQDVVITSQFGQNFPEAVEIQEHNATEHTQERETELSVPETPEVDALEDALEDLEDMDDMEDIGGVNDM